MDSSGHKSLALCSYKESASASAHCPFNPLSWEAIHSSLALPGPMEGGGKQSLGGGGGGRAARVEGRRRDCRRHALTGQAVCRRPSQGRRRPRINSAYVISRKRGIDILPPPVSLHSILRIREEVLIRAADNVDSVWEMNISFDITLCHLDPRNAAAHVSLAQTGVPMCVTLNPELIGRLKLGNVCFCIHIS